MRHRPVDDDRTSRALLEGASVALLIKNPVATRQTASISAAAAFSFASAMALTASLAKAAAPAETNFIGSARTLNVCARGFDLRAPPVARRRHRHAKQCPQPVVHESFHRCRPPM